MWNTPRYDTTKLTVELGEIVDAGVDIWDFEYPSYYEGEQKRAFERKVIDHYRFRQIGQETVGRWLHYFRTRVREIMPYYAQLYKSEALMASIDDPFGNIDITETFEREVTGSTRGESSSSEGSTSESGGTSGNTVIDEKERKFSNTPQGAITNIEKYMTDATVEDNTTTNNGTHSENSTVDSSSSSTSEGESSETERHTLTRKGNQGVNTYAHDMKELRDTFLNIDMMIINDLNDLFLGVY